MPLRGTNHSALVNDADLYFKSLAELDAWADVPHAKRSAVTEYSPRSLVDAEHTAARGSLLVCHDYKGGYTEKPSGLSYTFNFWSFCESFIYFAHHRVTIPPAGWINAAHRQGVKMLGTLIFEGDGQPDCLKLLVGRLPQSVHGPAGNSRTTLPISPHYARILALLAYQRGFDGYLLNFECPLPGGPEQTRALCAWIALLEAELRRVVGDHAQVIWYDSVIVDGQLRWQDRLNSLNLPFFLPSSGFFTNYTWRPEFPNLTAQYFLSLDPAHTARPRPKALKDIFVGVDVWGRGQHGGGGMACYKSLDHIDPESLGLSVALFGHAWTWETLEGQPGFGWERWWDRERTFWVGPAARDAVVAVPPPPEKQIVDDHGPFRSISSYFQGLPPPNPAQQPFFASFSPGVGRSWFVGGKKVLENEAGWTDVDKTSSLGDMLLPRPQVTWEHGERAETLPWVAADIDMEDAWLGGTSVRVSVDVTGSEAEDAFFRCLWIPIQSLAVTPDKIYSLNLVYKTTQPVGVEVDIGLVAKDPLESADVQISPVPAKCCELANGWSKLSIELSVRSQLPQDVRIVAGLILGFAMNDPTQDAQFFVNLGSLSVYAPNSVGASLEHQPRILWADFKKEPSPTAGTLTWGIGEFHVASVQRPLSGPEDPIPLWSLGSPSLAFAYFNIFALPHSASALSPDDAVFVGTTGLDGRPERFYVDPVCIPAEWQEALGYRYYIQGITSRGEILDWEHCAWVDVPV